MTLMLDTNINSAQKLGLSTVYGTAGTVSTAGNDISRQGTAIYGTAWNSAIATPATQTVAQQQTFCLPIISGAVGVGCDKCLPLGHLSDDIRLEWTFETQNTAVVYNNTTSTSAWTVIDMQLELCIIELSDEGESMVNSFISPEKPIYIHGNSWRHYTSTLPASTSGGQSFLVPARFGSLKSLFLCPRRSTEIVNPKGYSLSSRINPNFSQYWWRVGSSLLPSKYITLENSSNTGAYAEAFMSLQQAFHSVSTAANASVLPAPIYNVADYGSKDFTSVATFNPTIYTTGVQPIQTDASSYRNGFLIGQELESFALRSDVMLSGYNTLSQQIFFESQINTAIGATSYTLNFFANYDHVLVIDQGIMSVRF
jgi:hypothetical protein